MLIYVGTELSPTISIYHQLHLTIAEEANVASPNPAISGAEMEHSQEGNGAKATDIVGTSEPPKEGADQQEIAEGVSDFGTTSL